jgi:hypothetical protein
MRWIKTKGRYWVRRRYWGTKTRWHGHAQLEFEVPPLDTTSHATSHGRRATPSAYTLLLFDFGCK